MKKVLLILTAAATMVGLNSFGQGQFNFSSGARFVWNNTGATGVPGGPFNVAFLMTATGSTISNSAVGLLSGHSLIPTNSATGGGVQGPGYPSATDADWGAILNDPNFTFGRDLNQGSAIAIGTLTATGGITYNLASPFTAANTSAGGGNVFAFFVAWSNAFATPALARAGGSSVGWSSVFAYHYEATGVAPTAMGLQSINDGVDAHFGVVQVPEPTTFALAGLGAAAMLIFRRRK